MPDDATVPGPAGPPELDLLRLHYPGLRWRSAQRVTEGWDHVVLLLAGCTGPDARGHSELVFRFPDDKYAPLLESEIAALDLLAPRVEAAIPRYSHREYSSVGHGGAVSGTAGSGTAVFGGYPTIRGTRLTPGALGRLPRSDVTQIAGQLGELLSELHRQDTSAPPLDRLPPAWPAEDRHHLKELATRELPSRLTAEEMREVHGILDGLDQLLDAPVTPVFLHGDVYSSHLFWEPGRAVSTGPVSTGPVSTGPVSTGPVAPGRLGVIDFADMCLGDPAIDFAELYEYGPRFVDAVLARYLGPADDRLLDRAWDHQRLVAVYMLTDHIELGKQSWARARETFDRCRSPSRPTD
ncbi:aminoglycoside phosphotransferase family protein [Rhodococcus sp. IEGM 1408]|uniref:phosphotransferase family protein n=1 Tax=Rhodococcus sp. IEGM 1408 TaxID=3082220 RepID=UPI00295463D3|nr:aminoglycoside phosphotransferase family protein [Rhodococcus sp. IEGM 1408]MDV8002369.1 aminoglycoside phosphotransferase family protein [Rhodococcus sp. IEGM 1408]